MTKSILVLIVICCANYCFSQETRRDHVIDSLLHGTIDSEVTIITSELNVLYRGYPNIVIPSVANFHGLPVSLIGSGCTVSKKAGVEGYIVKPAGRGDTVTLVAVVHQGDSTILLRREMYRAVNLPFPDIYWGNSRSGRGLGLDLNSRTLSVKISEPISLKDPFSIVSWTINYSGNSISGLGDDLSNAESLIKQFESGTTLTIHAMVKGPDGITRGLLGVWVI